MAIRYIKQGARDPALVVTLNDESGTAVNVSAATSITLTMRTKNGTVLINQQTMSFVTDGTDGQVSYAWQAGSTDTPGEHDIEVDVNWASGTRTTFPDNGFGRVVIVADLDS